MSLYKQNIGQIGENIAINFLIKNHYQILDRNFRSRFGEIDIIAKIKNKLTFVEVKTRVGLEKGYPYEAINFKKLDNLKRVINYYLLKKKIKDSKLSMDVIGVLLDHNLILKSINHYESVEI